MNRLLLALIVCTLALSPALLWAEESPLAESPADSAGELNTKRAELQELNSKIQSYQSDIDSKKEEEFSLENYLETTSTGISQLELKIQKSEKELSLLSDEIDAKRAEIDELEDAIHIRQNNLLDYLAYTDRERRTPYWQLLFSSRSLGDFWRSVSMAKDIQANIIATTTEISAQKDSVQAENDELGARYEQVSATNSSLSLERQELNYQQSKYEKLKKQTGREITNLSQVLDNTAELREQIRNQIFLLERSDKSVRFDDAITAARFASSKTGVAPEIILAVLQQESSIGRNTGQCTYYDNMQESQKEYFIYLLNVLARDPATTLVSCRPTTYSGWGGAMGPGQFLPTTWKAYAEQVAIITGHQDPWDLTDAMVAVGLYLSAHGGSTLDAPGTDAAIGQFLAGSNWESHRWYVDSVREKALIFKEQLEQI